MLRRYLLSIVLVSSIVYGCVTADPLQQGQVKISRPLVSSRESLVLDRQRELAWLHSRLNAPTAHGIQGRRFTRDITSMTGSLSIQADPTVIKKYEAQQELDLKNIQRAKELTQVIHENKLAEEKANADLNAVKSSNYSSYIDHIIELNNLRTKALSDIYQNEKATKERICEDPQNSDPTADGEPSACEQATVNYFKALNQLKASLSEGEQISSVLKPGTVKYITGFKVETKPGTNGNETEMLVPIYGEALDLPQTDSQNTKSLEKIEEVAKELKAIKDVLTVDKTNASEAGNLSVTAIEAFEDDLAFRNRVNDQIAKVKLDERHDTYGNTLYRLQYAISVLPKDDNPNWVKVDLEVRPESTTLFPEGIFKWMYRVSKAERRISGEKLASPSIEPSAPLSRFNEEENTFLRKMSNYYKCYRPYFPRSVSTWANAFIFNVRKEIEREYTDTLNAWDNDKLSPEQIMRLDKVLGTICYTACKGETKGFNRIPSFLEEGCDDCKEPDNGFYLTGQPSKKRRYYRNIGRLSKDLYGDFTIFKTLKRDLLELQHYLLVIYSVSEVSRDYDFLKYLDVNLLEKDDVSSPGNFLNNMYLTWIKAPYPSPRQDNQQNIAQSQPNPTSDQCEPDSQSLNRGLWRFLSDLTAGYTADVYSVIPGESAQRVEDVAEIIKMFGLDVGVQFLAGTVGGEAAISYMKGKEKLFSTILRKPLVIGLPGETLGDECSDQNICKPKGIKFGWLIGPVFRIKNDRQEAEFLQSATKKIVSADVSLPSWWRSLSMKAKVTWIKPNQLDELKPYDLDIAQKEDPVYLPAQQPDFRELMRSSPRPIIKAEATGTRINGNDPVLILTGKDVWRVHEVSIGNQTSDQIEVLGDMGAIKVAFSKLTSSACTDNFSELDDKKKPSCTSVITLWSRSAAPVVYDSNARIFWKGPVDRQAVTDAIQFQSIFPPGTITVDPDKTDNLRVKIIANGIPKEALGTAAKTKWEVHFGDAIIREAIARDEGSDGQALFFSFSQKEAWFPSCAQVQPGDNCDIEMRIHYDGKLLKNGTRKYNMTRKAK